MSHQPTEDEFHAIANDHLIALKKHLELLEWPKHRARVRLGDIELAWIPDKSTWTVWSCRDGKNWRPLVEASLEERVHFVANQTALHEAVLAERLRIYVAMKEHVAAVNGGAA